MSLRKRELRMVGSQSEKAKPNGLLRANRTDITVHLSRGDGEETSLKNQRMLVRRVGEIKIKHFVKPGGTAGLETISCPSKSMQGQDFL